MLARYGKYSAKMDAKQTRAGKEDDFLTSESIFRSIEQALEKLDKAREEFRKATGESTSGEERAPAEDKPNENPKP